MRSSALADSVMGLFGDCGTSAVRQLVRSYDVISRLEQCDMTSKGAYVRVDRCYLHEFIILISLHDILLTSFLPGITLCTVLRYCVHRPFGPRLPHQRSSEGLLKTLGQQPTMAENKGNDTGPAKHTIGMVPIPVRKTRSRG